MNLNFTRNNQTLCNLSASIASLALILCCSVVASAICHSSGYYNVKTDFGAVGNGFTDDTVAITNAIDCIRNRPGYGGGTLFFPEGFYRVVNTGEGIDLPSGIIIEGVSGKAIGSSRIQLDSDNSSIFRIQGGINKVTIRDITLRTTALEMVPARTFRAGSKAIYAKGPTTLSSGSGSGPVLIHNVDFSGFERAFDVQSFDPVNNWQFDQITLDQINFFECDNNIYVNTLNGAWIIRDSILGVDKKAEYSVLSTAIVIERIGGMVIENSQGAGPPVDRITNPTGVADAFLWIKGQYGAITFINSTTENFYNSIVADWGTYGATIKSINSTWGDRILLRADTVFVSTGNRYHSDTFQVVPPAHALLTGAPGTHANATGSTGTILYSMGDMFTYTTSDIKSCLPTTQFPPANESTQCRRDFYTNNLGTSWNAIVFRSGQTGTEGGQTAVTDFQRPVRIGNGGCDTCHYRIERDNVATDGTLAYLSFSGQQSGYKGFKFNGPVIPNADNSVNLGSPNFRWKEARVVNLYTGDSILVDKETGMPLYKIHEDPNFIYFDDIRTGKNLMKLDTEGNLHLAGRVIEGSLKGEKTGRGRSKSGSKKKSR